MAILNHIASKSANYTAAYNYLKYEHDEFLNTPILNERGKMVLRKNILLDGINCCPETFDIECEILNAQYHKKPRIR